MSLFQEWPVGFLCGANARAEGQTRGLMQWPGVTQWWERADFIVVNLDGRLFCGETVKELNERISAWQGKGV